MKLWSFGGLASGRYGWAVLSDQSTTKNKHNKRKKEMQNERKIPVFINGRIHHYITPNQLKRMSFWKKHQQTICDWLTLAALIALIELMFLTQM